ncbi:TetR/AcrR family transcriptional regulator [Cognatishimia sp. SS12]|uniref:TetR/AcrR family transcriptional regulator n=1 Tax=Cognatishimia sp. SS12 TaxID=2979465 RepID=UPI00232B7AA1|nr:TetR/AcrR family transcriptional regulator [Cognatishimia sp. SS12]MDC0738248.1 TetR/AcrR family transcriptional regulator [Cognatishimia sp. SS12]
MVKTQTRTLKTRAKLLESARNIVTSTGYEALRVEHVVQQAGVAKGTFFAHFKDKDALMEALIAPELHHFLDEIEQRPAPKDIESLTAALRPVMQFAVSERYIFDVILRHSGAAAKAEIGPIASVIFRMGEVLANWLAKAPFRKDISPALLADGIGAFLFQALALHFCALNNTQSIEDRMQVYLHAWLLPQV